MNQSMGTDGMFAQRVVGKRLNLLCTAILICDIKMYVIFVCNIRFSSLNFIKVITWYEYNAALCCAEDHNSSAKMTP